MEKPQLFVGIYVPIPLLFISQSVCMYAWGRMDVGEEVVPEILVRPPMEKQKNTIMVTDFTV